MSQQTQESRNVSHIDYSDLQTEDKEVGNRTGKIDFDEDVKLLETADDRSEGEQKKTIDRASSELTFELKFITICMGRWLEDKDHIAHKAANDVKYFIQKQSPGESFSYYHQRSQNILIDALKDEWVQDPNIQGRWKDIYFYFWLDQEEEWYEAEFPFVWERLHRTITWYIPHAFRWRSQLREKQTPHFRLVRANDDWTHTKRVEIARFRPITPSEKRYLVFANPL